MVRTKPSVGMIIIRIENSKVIARLGFCGPFMEMSKLHDIISALSP